MKKLKLSAKLEFWKTSTSVKLKLFNKDLKNSINGEISECDFFLILYNEMCHHMEGLSNSVNQQFSYDQSMKLQNHAW